MRVRLQNCSTLYEGYIKQYNDWIEDCDRYEFNYELLEQGLISTKKERVEDGRG